VGETSVSKTPDGVLSLCFQHTLQHMDAGEGSQAQELDLYFAFTFPYPLCEVRRHVRSVCKRLVSQGAYVHRERLANSLGGRCIELFTITGHGGLRSGRQPPLTRLRPCGKRPHVFLEREAVFVSSRVHPGETPASYMLEGFLEFLASNSPAAQQLLQRYVFHVLPVLNPDGVELGHHRMDLRGKNLNRVYGSATLEEHPSIVAAEDAVISAHYHQNGLRLYLDLHAHSSTRGVFLFGDAREGEGQVQARLFGHALSRRCRLFEYSQSNFKESNSKEALNGTGKTWAIGCTGVPLCFTVESHYSRGHHRKATFLPKDWRLVGSACLEALWDLDQPPDHVPELKEALHWLEAEHGVSGSVSRRQAPRHVMPSRALPQFAMVWPAEDDHRPSSAVGSSPERLIGRCVEVVERLKPPRGSCAPAQCVLHEDDGGLQLPESDLLFRESQVGRFLYKALYQVPVTREESPRSEEFRVLQRGAEVVAEERRVVEDGTKRRLRLKLASGGWVSEYYSVLYDARLGGVAQLMRIDRPCASQREAIEQVTRITTRSTAAEESQQLRKADDADLSESPATGAESAIAEAALAPGAHCEPMAGSGTATGLAGSAVPAGHGSWQLVFRQRRRPFGEFNLSKNVNDESSDLFCRLKDLGNHCDADGLFTFKMVYPERKPPNHLIWSQRTNPITMRKGGVVLGFKAVDTPGMGSPTGSTFGGLQRSRYGEYLLHNYDPNEPDFCKYVVGCRDWALWYGADANTDVRCVELYVLLT